jgi:hypothetical protein
MGTVMALGTEGSWAGELMFWTGDCYRIFGRLSGVEGCRPRLLLERRHVCLLVVGCWVVGA